MEKSKTVKYNFEFYFYNKYAVNYDRYFNDKMRLTIWSEENENIAFPAMFNEFELVNDKIIGTMILLLKDSRNLYEIKNRKYYMNNPNNLVGHLILLEGNEEIIDQNR